MKAITIVKRIALNLIFIILATFVMDKIVETEQSLNEYFSNNVVTVLVFTIIFLFIDLNKIFKKKEKNKLHQISYSLFFYH